MDFNQTTLDDCIKINAKFEHCPICKRTHDSFKENQNLIEREHGFEIEDMKKEMQCRC